MEEENTTTAVQRYLDELPLPDGDSRPEPAVRALLGRSAHRLHRLCVSLLSKSYPRLARPPLNLQADELLGAVVERLLKALREARPADPRQFFALASQHMRWELNEMARRLDEQPAAAALGDESWPAPAGSGSGLTPNARRMLEAIERLPEDEREAFELVRIQGMSQTEAARVVGVSVATVNRRLARSLQLLADELGDLYPDEEDPAEL
ncbi:sigma-70 family RNA polymerase sigma factor [Gemmata sp. G18]|uniref:Sigma-70 family RNA polymerase sigma factor n=1 Tax=Gemmata palustris TaxID=2822762 RepID=A0ABS5BMD0_9BACT|nr:sigma-70 family RNA polymerase sigma factor [Gemmata palustris]MBP3954879.1 sigma-70 family RNA polymerase sigma factor [Gemmata palustris]